MDEDLPSKKNFSLTLGILKVTTYQYSTLLRGSMPHHCYKENKIDNYNSLLQVINSTQEVIDTQSKMIYSYLVRFIDIIIDSLSNLPATELLFKSFNKFDFIKNNFAIKAINFVNAKKDDIDETITNLYLIQANLNIVPDGNSDFMNHEEYSIFIKDKIAAQKEKKAADGIAVLKKRSKALVERHEQPSDHDAESPRHGEEPPCPEESSSSNQINLTKKKAKKNRSGSNDNAKQGSVHTYTPPVNNNQNINPFDSLNLIMANSGNFFDRLSETITNFNPSTLQLPVASNSCLEPPKKSIVEKIDELNKLKENGSITSEKCEQMIDKLLEQIYID